MGEASRNLLIVHTPGGQGIDDWRTVKAKIEARAPDIEVRIAENGRPNSVTRRWQVRRPSLVFSVAPLHLYRPKGGKVYAGCSVRTLAKWEEIRRLREADLPVPETVRLTPDLRLTGAPWLPYVVVKPEAGFRGRMIRLVRTEDLTRRYADLTSGGRVPMLVQRYVDHIDVEGYPKSHRVVVLFGHELQAGTMRMNAAQRPLAELADDPNAIIAVNDDSVTRSRRLLFEEDVIALARSTHRAFPEIPVLGVDIVREAETGRLFILETNPSGYVWHFSSSLGKKYLPAESRQRMYEQFGALDRTASLLIEKTRAEAI